MKVNNNPPVRLAGLLTIIPGLLILLEWVTWIHLPKWALGSCYLLIAVSLFWSFYYQRREERRTNES